MIKFKTINCDGFEIEREFNTFDEFLKDWNSDECSLPMGDDELTFAEVDGIQVTGKTFEDLISYVFIG